MVDVIYKEALFFIEGFNYFNLNIKNYFWLSVVKQQRREKRYNIKVLSFLLPGKLHATIREEWAKYLNHDVCPF